MKNLKVFQYRAALKVTTIFVCWPLAVEAVATIRPTQTMASARTVHTVNTCTAVRRWVWVQIHHHQLITIAARIQRRVASRLHVVPSVGLHHHCRAVFQAAPQTYRKLLVPAQAPVTLLSVKIAAGQSKSANFMRTINKLTKKKRKKNKNQIVLFSCDCLQIEMLLDSFVYYHQFIIPFYAIYYLYTTRKVHF